MARIEKYKEQIEKYVQKIAELEKKRTAIVDKIRELNRKKYKAESGIEKILADKFRKEAKRGEHKIVYYNEIPRDIRREWQQIEDKITGGCTGDWYDGCRGCSNGCGRKAKEEFKKKYNIEEIRYGRRPEDNIDCYDRERTK